jgi:hypothetical protein
MKNAVLKTDMYQRYADLAHTIREASAEQRELQPRIISYVKRHGASVRKDYGTFTVVDYPSYQYSSNVIELEAKLNDVKKLEREAGVATIKSVTNSLRYTSK